MPVDRVPAGLPVTLVETTVLTVGAVAVVIGGWTWAGAELGGRLGSGRWPRISYRAVAAAVAAWPRHLSDPRWAWPAAVGHQLPGPGLLYGCYAGLLLPAGVGSLWWHHRRSQRQAPGGGVGPARWARAADLKPLRSSRRSNRGRLTVGRAGRRGWGRLLATEARHSVLVIGPTQSGKTTGLAIPAILEWPGPVVATSVKDDLAATTCLWRSSRGPCWAFDPTGSSSVRPSRWSPLAACTDWSASQRVAAWLVDATPARSGVADAAFWYAAAAKQLAPLLLASARSDLGMAAVVRWTNAGDFDEPGRLLDVAAEYDAMMAITACAGRDERIRSSVATTLETVLAPFEDPVVAAATATSDVDCRRLLASKGTLYLCGPSHEQQRVQGLFAALVSWVVDAAVRVVNTTGRPLDPPLLLVLDEAANIAPVRDLDTLASTAAGFGIQLVTVCQDLAQLAGRYGPERARTVANNHRAKVLLPGVSDLGTLDLVSGLAGERAVREHSLTHDLRDGRQTRSTTTTYRRLAPTDELRRLPPGHAVLVYGHLPPAPIRLRPWYRDRKLRRRAAGAGAGVDQA